MKNGRWYHLFYRSLRDVPEDGHWAFLSHPDHSSDSLFFNCRVPLRFDDVNFIRFRKSKAELPLGLSYWRLASSLVTYPTAPVLMDIKRTFTSGSWRNFESSSVRPSSGLRPSTWTNRIPSKVSSFARMSNVSLQLDNTTLLICQKK